jgi:hypothetical protein
MKAIITLATLFFYTQLFAQSKSELEILKLSKEIFNWEVADKIDSLANIFNEKFVVVGSTGELQTRDKYLALLRSGNFVHNSIEIEENIATVVDNTATVFGKGKFTVTVSGNKITLRLSYIEVFTRPYPGKEWKILAMHASKLPDQD